jgi:four helix bundle protein
MSEFGDIVQGKCDAFADRVVKLNDFLLAQAANQKYEVQDMRAENQASNFKRQTSSRVPVFLQSVATISNQLLRAGTSIGANNSEATSAISKADYKAKSYIALKEARESLYWINLLHRNGYLEEKEYKSIYVDANELVKIFVARCKKLDSEG